MISAIVSSLRSWPRSSRAAWNRCTKAQQAEEEVPMASDLKLAPAADTVLTRKQSPSTLIA
jgi:hypothetical protein